jgi:hypothetical protein
VQCEVQANGTAKLLPHASQAQRASAYAKASARSWIFKIEHLAIARRATEDHVFRKLVPLRPKPFQKRLQILSDSLIENLLFRLATPVDVGLAVEGKRLHAAKAKQAMGQYLASG